MSEDRASLRERLRRRLTELRDADPPALPDHEPWTSAGGAQAPPRGSSVGVPAVPDAIRAEMDRGAVWGAVGGAGFARPGSGVPYAPARGVAMREPTVTEVLFALELDGLPRERQLRRVRELAAREDGLLPLQRQVLRAAGWLSASGPG